VIQIDGVADLLACRLITLNFPIDAGAATGFGVRVIFTDRVDFDIEAVSGKELLI